MFPLSLIYSYGQSYTFFHDASEKFLRVRDCLAVVCAAFVPPSISLVSTALELPLEEFGARFPGPQPLT